MSQVTGKAKVEYYFDPTLILSNEEASPLPSSSSATVPPRACTPLKKQAPGAAGGGSNPSSNLAEDEQSLFISKHLYVPCSIVKKDLDLPAFPNAALVKTNDGSLYRVRDSTLLTAVSNLDRTGVPGTFLVL